MVFSQNSPATNLLKVRLPGRCDHRMPQSLCDFKFAFLCLWRPDLARERRWFYRERLKSLSPSLANYCAFRLTWMVARRYFHYMYPLRVPRYSVGPMCFPLKCSVSVPLTLDDNTPAISIRFECPDTQLDPCVFIKFNSIQFNSNLMENTMGPTEYRGTRSG